MKRKKKMKKIKVKKERKQKVQKPIDMKNKIVCTVSGQICYISPERRAKLEKKYGGPQKLITGYVCRAAKTLLKLGASESEIRSLGDEGRLNLVETLKSQKAMMKSTRKRRRTMVVEQEDGSKVVVKKPKLVVPTFLGVVAQPQSEADLTKTLQDTCMRPDLGVEENCDLCPHKDLCHLHCKVLQSEKRKKNKKEKYGEENNV